MKRVVAHGLISPDELPPVVQYPREWKLPSSLIRKLVQYVTGTMWLEICTEREWT